LSECYWPTFWAFYCHLSTIIRVILQKKPDIKYRRCVQLLTCLLLQAGPGRCS
jgi:hypothetical protein